MNELTQQFQYQEPGPRIKVFLRMTDYGIVVSGMGGAMYGLALILGMLNEPSTPVITVLAGFFLGSIFGGLFGLFYGSLASPIIGLALALLAAVCFRDGRRPRLLKLMFGAVTAAIILLVSPLDVVKGAFAQILQGSSATALADFSAIAVYCIAIYVSQIVARKYLREAATTKWKAKS